jgi:ssDNA-binding Zn-finger/Zn-ribbon topoisomerase 1
MAKKVKCPKCDTEMVVHEKNFQYGAIEIRNTECMRCPKCEYEMYTKEQYALVLRSINELNIQLFDGY